MSTPIAISVTVARLRVPASAITGALTLLDERELAAASTRTGDARRRYVAAHAAARVVIGTRLGTESAAVRLAVEPGGRPVIEGVAGVVFSMAHSGERAVIAIAVPGASVGVDVERVRSRPYLDGLARRVFDAAGYERWAALPARRRARAFAARWTELEAVLKGRGTGLAGGLASAIDAPGWSCAPIDVGRGYVGAVAAEGSAIAVAVYELDLADVLGRGLPSRCALTRRDGTAH